MHIHRMAELNRAHGSHEAVHKTMFESHPMRVGQKRFSERPRDVHTRRATSREPSPAAKSLWRAYGVLGAFCEALGSFHRGRLAG